MLQLHCSWWYPVCTSCLLWPLRHSPSKFPGSAFVTKSWAYLKATNGPEAWKPLTLPLSKTPTPNKPVNLVCPHCPQATVCSFSAINYECPPIHICYSNHQLNNVWINEETPLKAENCGGLNFESCATAASIKALLSGLTPAGFYFLKGLELTSSEHEQLNSRGMAWKLAQKCRERMKSQMKKLASSTGAKVFTTLDQSELGQEVASELGIFSRTTLAGNSH